MTIPLWEWMPAIGASFELLWDPLAALMALVVTGVGTLIHVFAIGYMHGDERFHRFFTYLNLFAASMLTLVLAGNYAMLFLGMGAGRALLLSADWVLVHPDDGGGRGQEGIHRQPNRRLRVHGRPDAGLRRIRHPLLRRRLRTGRGGAHRGDGNRDRAAPAGWRRRQVGADPALRVAARRDGGPDSCLRPDPCRDDGDGRGLRHRPVRPDLRVHTGRLDGGRNRGGADRDMGGLHRPGPERYQEGPRLLDHLPARLHVPRCRGEGICRRRVPSHDPCLLQGIALPRCRLGDPRHERRAGHAPNGRPPSEDAGDRHHHGGRSLGPGRDPAVGRLLVEGRDPRGGLRQGRLVLHPLDHRADHRPAHRLLHRQALGARVHGRAEMGGGAPTPTSRRG